MGPNFFFLNLELVDEEDVNLVLSRTIENLRATAHKYGPNNGTNRTIDFAHFLPIDWP